MGQLTDCKTNQYNKIAPTHTSAMNAFDCLVTRGRARDRWLPGRKTVSPAVGKCCVRSNLAARRPQPRPTAEDDVLKNKPAYYDTNLIFS